MSYLKDLDGGDGDVGLMSVFMGYAETCGPLIEFHEKLLRSEDSPFSVAERELMAAFVSGLNACGYCHGIHKRVAERFGVAEGLVKGLVEDIDSAEVDEKMKPVLRYVRKLTLEPAKIVQADAEAVFAAGWDDRALYEAVMTCGLFNLMNRMVEGLGIDVDDAYLSFSAERLSEGGYGKLLKLMNPTPNPGPRTPE